MQITRPASVSSQQQSVHFAGKLSDDKEELAQLRSELDAMNQKMDRYDRRARKAANAGREFGESTGLLTGAGAGLAADVALTTVTGGANLVLAPAVATMGGAAAGQGLAKDLGGFFGKAAGGLVRGWGKLFNEDEHNTLKQSVSSLSGKVNQADSTLATLRDLETVARKAKYASQLTGSHKSAFEAAKGSEYEELNARHQALRPILAKVPSLGWGEGDERAAFQSAKTDLSSSDARTKALALRRLYQAELGANRYLEESPAVYKKHLMSPEERVAAASIRAMIEEPELRPGHYNQVLASALVSGKPKLQKAALLGLKEQLQPQGSHKSYYFRSILVDQALQDIVEGRNVSGKSKTKLQGLAREVLALRNQNRKNPEQTVVEEAAEMATRPFAGNDRLKGKTETYLNVFQQAMGQDKGGANLMLFSAGPGGIGKTQYSHNIANEALGSDSLLNIDLSSLKSQQELENTLIQGATGHRDGKYRFDGRTIFMDEFQQLGTNPARESLIPLLKKMTGKEEIPNLEFKNAIISMASNDEPDEIKGLKGSSDGKTLANRLESFPRQVNLSNDIKNDADGFVHRYINAKAYLKDYPHLEGVQFFPAATRHFQEELRADFPADGSRKLSPRKAISQISQSIEDAMANTPGFKEKHTQGSPFIVDKDRSTGRLKAIAVQK